MQFESMRSAGQSQRPESRRQRAIPARAQVTREGLGIPTPASKPRGDAARAASRTVRGEITRDRLDQGAYGLQVLLR